MTRQRRTHLTNVFTHNAMPHAANCTTTRDEEPIATLPIDSYFKNHPIRAIDHKELAGSITSTGSAPVQLPVYEMSINGLADETRVRETIYVKPIQNTTTLAL